MGNRCGTRCYHDLGHAPPCADAPSAPLLSREPLVRLFSAMANWVASVLMTEHRAPELEWSLRFEKPRWRLSLVVDGETVFSEMSSHVGQLAIDAERTFRDWSDEDDRKRNEARLEASVTEMRGS